jgi:hypothetical protein
MLGTVQYALSEMYLTYMTFRELEVEYNPGTYEIRDQFRV